MTSDIGHIKLFYEHLEARSLKIKERAGRPLTLAEKLLFLHLSEEINPLPSGKNRGYYDFSPDRVAMQDATAQMALLQFMVTGNLRSAVPSSVHCDHLITAADGADNDLKLALEANREVYDFLRSACIKYGIDFWEPGSGIIHQIILENYAFPGGMIIGSDSHTPNAGGLGMMAIGVGGADVMDVMAGMNWELKLPSVTGVKLNGKLGGWTSAKDIILKINGLFTVRGGTGHIIEYFGEGAEHLSCTGKATICNMGAETGATSSVFGFDSSMSEYLKVTGREEVAALAEANSMFLVADPEVHENPGKYYDRFIEINLSDLEPYINGPFTPDRAIPVSRMKSEAEKNGWPVKVETGLIGSCTNSSYEDMTRSASVVRQAISLDLVFKSEFKITPGSEQIKTLAEKDGLIALFRSAGGDVLANACGPCIGQWKRKRSAATDPNTIIHSFNRNFSGRADGNPNTHAFVASPEMVTAISLAGKLTFNPLTDYIENTNGEKVRLSEPAGKSLPAEGFPGTARKEKPLSYIDSVEILISPESERLQKLTPFPEWEGSDLLNMPLLIKAGGKCTTDHISMAGPWLRYRGHLKNISRNYMIGARNFFNGKENTILNQLTGTYGAVPDIAKIYRDVGLGSVVVGEDNFGEGSSREHAAMEPRFLGVRVVLVKSFARIHETNLKKQGILTLTFTDNADYDRIRETDRMDVTGLTEFAPGKPLVVRLHHQDGTGEEFMADHSYNEAQISWFKAGSALNLIRKYKNEGYG